MTKRFEVKKPHPEWVGVRFTRRTQHNVKQNFIDHAMGKPVRCKACWDAAKYAKEKTDGQSE